MLKQSPPLVAIRVLKAKKRQKSVPRLWSVSKYRLGMIWLVCLLDKARQFLPLNKTNFTIWNLHYPLCIVLVCDMVFLKVLEMLKQFRWIKITKICQFQNFDPVPLLIQINFNINVSKQIPVSSGLTEQPDTLLLEEYFAWGPFDKNNEIVERNTLLDQAERSTRNKKDYGANARS